MAECSICGDANILARKCNYCGGTYCTKHTLPEKHNCPAVRATNNAGKRFESAFNDNIDDAPSKSAGDAPSPKKPSDLPPSPGRAKSPDQPSSPDVAPDGSIKTPSDKNTEQEKTTTTKTSDSVLLTLMGTLLLPFMAGQWLLSRLLTKHGLLICLIGIASAGQLGYAPVPGMPVTDNPASTAADGAQDLLGSQTTAEPGGGPAGDTVTRDAATTAGEDDSSGLFERDELDRSKIGTAVHEEINERRQDHGESQLAFDDHLQEIARGHSTDMAENEYFSHTAPDGSDFADRYDRAGYDCRVSTGGNRYATGAENIAYTYADENIKGPNGDTQYYTTEQELAEGLVNGWMNSSGHRENILRSYWQHEGIGISIVEVDGKTRVYATQNFC